MSSKEFDDQTYELRRFWAIIFFLSWPGFILAIFKIKAYEQQRRDDYAFHLFNAITSGQIANFAVFLRPFFLTGKLWTFGSDPSTSSGNTVHKLEGTLIKALSMPVLALGMPGEVWGAGRILMDEDNWKNAVSELMVHALLIICIPSTRPGSKWELGEILHKQYLGKTVFLMPFDNLLFQWKAIRNDWRDLVAHMDARGSKSRLTDEGGFCLR